MAMTQNINPEIAEIMGAFIGDGWIEKRGSAIYITGDKIEDKEYYDNFLACLFTNNFLYIKPKEFPYWGVYGVSCYKKQVIKKCIELGFQQGKKVFDTKIPESIIQSRDYEVLKAVIRGIFDTDGSFWCERSRAKTSVNWKRVHHYHPEIGISSCSKQLLDQIKLILDHLKIESKVVSKSKAGFKCGRNIHDAYLLRIRKKKDIENWFDIIRSNNPRHQTRYAVWKRFGFLPPRTNINQRKDFLEGRTNPESFYNVRQ